MSKIGLTLPGEVVNGKQVSFVAPCGSDTVEYLTINNIDYIICDANNNNIAGVGGIWCDGAVISVIINTTTRKAYIQNPSVIDDTSPSSSTKTRSSEWIENKNNVINSRIDNLIESKEYNNGSMSYAIRYEDCTINVTYSGTAAHLLCIPKFTIAPNENRDFALTENLRPLSAVIGLEGFTAHNGISSTVVAPGGGVTPYIRISNRSTEDIDLSTAPIEFVYNLLNITIPELSDIRVGYNGEQYDSAGMAVRKQISDIINTGTGTGTDIKEILMVVLNEDEGYASHTSNQIYEAFQNGCAVICTLSTEADGNTGEIINTSSIQPNKVVFTSIYDIGQYLRFSRYFIENSLVYSNYTDYPKLDNAYNGGNLDASGYDVRCGRLILNFEDASDVSIRNGENGNIILSGSDIDDPIRLSQIAPGIDDMDAVNKGQLNEAIGDVEVALDAIIAIQNKLMGVEETVSFTIDGSYGGGSYTVPKGMTWGEIYSGRLLSYQCVNCNEENNAIFICGDEVHYQTCGLCDAATYELCDDEDLDTTIYSNECPLDGHVYVET